ncbi:MAG: LamG domain-containing protein, partial [Nitrospiraceae bacterium]
FINPGDYIYDAAKVLISDGTASLVLVDQTDDDNASTGFGGGAHSSTVWDNSNNLLKLNPGNPPFDASGYFTSRIIDAGASTSWSALSWTPQRPYYKELPDNAQSETAYPEGNADMTGNVLLMHMNEDNWNGAAGEVYDSSGSGNHGTAYNGVNTSAGGKFGRAGNFNGVSGYIKVPDSDSLDLTGPMTITAWIYPRNAGGSNQGGIVSKNNGAVSGTGYKFSIDEGNCYTRSLMFNWSCSDPDVLTYNQWQHVAVVYDGINAFFYVDAVPAGTDQPYPRAANTLDIAIGSWFSSGAAKIFDGYIDEVAIYNRALTAQEIIDSYVRGAVRLKYQARSCDDSACDGENFSGPDGTSSTYYSELSNSTADLPADIPLFVTDSRYFQYKAYLETDNISYSPELKNVTIGPAHYPGDGPVVINNIGQTYIRLDTFTETLGEGNAGDIRYQISNNGGHWYYHDGIKWAPATAGFDHSNTASEVNVNMPVFRNYAVPGTFYFKAFLQSDTYQQVELNRVSLSYVE